MSTGFWNVLILLALIWCACLTVLVVGARDARITAEHFPPAEPDIDPALKRLLDIDSAH